VILFILENMLIEVRSVSWILRISANILNRSYDINMTQEEPGNGFFIKISIAGRGGEIFEFSFKHLEPEWMKTFCKDIVTSYMR
jgi:hypothetical protein